MRFEVFDRDTTVLKPAPTGPMVRVNEQHRLLFNRPAWQFLAMQCLQFELALAFDVETCTAAARPAVDADRPGARWSMQALRSTQWPMGIDAKAYVEHYRIGVGDYQAWLMRGPGPRMVTFDVSSGAVLAGADGGRS